MHDTALLIGSAAIKLYGPRRRGLIVELGSMNVNGSLRSAASTHSRYIGIDQAPGFGVDLVVPPGTTIPLEDGAADLVIASSVFEHDLMFWETFLQMCRLAKTGGHIYISAPSNGSIHRFPVDCWRFYPDAGLALEAHARKSGLGIRLIESFVAERIADQWNDFVAVFKREQSLTNDKPRRKARLHEQFNCRNVYDASLAECSQPDAPEDLRILARLKEAAAIAVPDEVHRRLVSEASIASQSLAEATQAVASLRAEVELTAADLQNKNAEIEKLSLALKESSEEVTSLARDVEESLHNLRERNAELERRKSDLEYAKKELAELTAGLHDRDGRILALKSEVGAMSQECAQQAQQMSLLGSAKAMLQYEVTQLGSQIASLAAKVVELEREATAATTANCHLHEQLSNRDATIDSLNKALAEADGTKEELAVRERDYVHLTQALRTANQEVDRLSGDVIRYRTMAEECRNALTTFASALRPDRKMRRTFFSLLGRLTGRSNAPAKQLPPPTEERSHP
ncbi:MAG: methyltransferase domain-containing protein [Pseudomonadota bacterium]